MDSSSIAIGVILLLLFAGPIGYVILQQNYKTKKNINLLRTIGSQHQMVLNEIELTNSLMLGLDSGKKKLIIVEPGNSSQFKIIDLNTVNLSKVSKNGLAPQNGGIANTGVTHITLDLIMKNSSEKVAEIVFYDEEDSSSYNAETQLFLANKWDQLIRSGLTA